MGYYTRVHLELKLRKDTPKPLIDTIKRIVTPKDWPDDVILGRNELAYFKTDYPHQFFECSRYIGFFIGQNCDELRGASLVDFKDHWYLYIDSELKLHDELDEFMDLITPFVVGRKMKEYVGWYKGEGWECSRINIYIERPLGGFKR